MALCACAVSPEVEADLGAAQQAEEAVNGLAMNGLAMNGLAMNGLAMNGLVSSALTVQTLSSNSAVKSALDSDPLARMFLSYVVSCALPEGRKLVFPTLGGQSDVTFPGELGVAPEWGGSACGQSCRQWVSACVLSRVNALGQHVPLSLRGKNAALKASAAERAAYPRREATYFGDVLTVPQQRYACRAARDDQSLIGRVCGDGADVTGCGITVLGACERTCASMDATDGYFSSCGSPTVGTFVPAVTVFRQ